MNDTRAQPPAAPDAQLAAEDPQPGETCQFHPGCCQPADTTCPGCGDGAVTVIVLRNPANPGGLQRFPLCAACACEFRADLARQGASPN